MTTAATVAQTIAITINPTTEALPTITTADTTTTTYTLASQTSGPTQSSSVTTIPSLVTTSQPASNTEGMISFYSNNCMLSNKKCYYYGFRSLKLLHSPIWAYGSFI